MSSWFTKRLRRLTNSSEGVVLSKSVAIQLGGYAISLALMPVAIAFYSPAQFGAFSVVLFAANLIGTFGGMRLEWAVINEHSERTADFLLRFSHSLLIGWGIAAFLLFLSVPERAYTWFETGRGAALLAAPVAIAVGFGVFQQAWGIRRKAYPEVYLSRNAVMISRQLFQIGLGLASPSVLALLISEAAARSLGVGIMVRRLGKKVSALAPARFVGSVRKVLFGRYGHYSRVALPSSLLTFAMSESLPVLFVLLYDIETAGAFWLVQRIFGLPIALIGTVVADVFQGQIARQRDYSQVLRQMRQVTLLLIFFSLATLPFGAVAFRLLTEHFYDGRWLLSGQIALYMLPAVCIQFIASPVSRILIVREKMHYKLIFDAVLFAGLAAWLLATAFANLTFFTSVAYLAAAQFIAYGLYLAICFHVARQT